MEKCLNVSKDQLVLSVYVHSSYKNKTDSILNFWSKAVGTDRNKLRIYFTNTASKKRVKDNNYFGQLRIDVRKSTDLNRKISGWIKGIYQQSKKL